MYLTVKYSRQQSNRNYNLFCMIVYRKQNLEYIAIAADVDQYKNAIFVSTPQYDRDLPLSPIFTHSVPSL